MVILLAENIAKRNHLSELSTLCRLGCRVKSLNSGLSGPESPHKIENIAIKRNIIMWNYLNMFQIN